MTHLIEHLLLRAPSPPGRPSMESLATSMNGETLQGLSYVYLVTAKGKLGELVGALAARWQKLTVDEATVREETRRMLVEKSFVERSAPARLHNGVYARAYAQSRPYRWGKLGLLETKGPFAVKDTARFFESHYVPSRALLILGGELPPGELDRGALGALKGIPARRAPAIAPMVHVRAPQPKAPLVVEDPQTTGWQLLVAWPSPAALGDEDLALTLAGMLLQQRLFFRLGAAGGGSWVSAQNDLLSGPGHLFLAQLAGPFPKASTPEQGLAALHEEIARLGVPTEAELAVLAAAHRQGLVFSIRLPASGAPRPAWEAAVQSAINLARVELVLGEGREALFDRMAKLRPSDVGRAATRYLKPGLGAVGILRGRKPQ
jgi:predicted Zn-dependent peptidase